MKPAKGQIMNALWLKFKARIDARVQVEGSDAGVGLIEMLVALAILAIGLVGFIGVYVAVGKATKMAADRQAAINIAAQQLSLLEGYEAMDWQYSANIPSSITNPSPFVVGGAKYSSVTSVSNCGNGTFSVPTLVATVVVTWQYGTLTLSYKESAMITASVAATGIPACPPPS